MYFRFFNPLYYMLETEIDKNWKYDRYWYSYQIQKYAMEQVLKEKWFINPKYIVDLLITKASKYTPINEEKLYFFAHNFFQDEDWIKIAQIYKRIWVELLKQMKPYFKKPIVELV
jgi:hypothetical protein